MASKRAPQKAPAKIPPETAERIVAIALQHPELGARRLVPLLKKKRISVSATSVQNILRRHNLQTRAMRLAKAKPGKKSPKTRKPKAQPQKPSPQISDKVAARIVDISLQNPDFGAQRLVPLLEEQEIFASSSAVYRVLKRNGLQTRQIRLDKAAQISAAPVIFPKKFPDKIPPEVEDRIVGLSLENPDLGARRLMQLLQQEDIFVSAASVYKILKRNDLENRPKRLLKLKEQQIPEVPVAAEAEGPIPVLGPPETEPAQAAEEMPEPVIEPSVAVPIPPAAEAPVPVEEPQPVTESIEIAPAEPEPPPARKTLLTIPRTKSHWIFYPLYLLLLLLIGYLGFQAVQAIQISRQEADAVAVSGSAGGRPSVQPQASIRPLSDYQVIWQRNLFNVALSKDSDKQEEISLDKIALAKKDIGLELVGTVVADDPGLSRAIIDNRKTREQEAYREGDNAGTIKIKKILRNNVIITTAKGDELLTVEIKESAKGSTSFAPSKSIGSRSPSSQSSPQSNARRPRTLARTRSIKLKREDVETSLADVDALMEKVNVRPYMQGDQPSGFRISNIPADSVLRKMGLRSRDVIVGVGEDDITSPDQASDFFERLASGEEITIRVKRRRRTRQIKLNIE
ncbi:MAG: type II secretion system protein N [Desulfobacterales bacterium]